MRGEWERAGMERGGGHKFQSTLPFCQSQAFVFPQGSGKPEMGAGMVRAGRLYYQLAEKYSSKLCSREASLGRHGRQYEVDISGIGCDRDDTWAVAARS